jgi:DNA-binding NarL/FixJ family response regulator
MIKILIAEGHAQVRRSLRDGLTASGVVEVLGDAGTAELLMALLEQMAPMPDVALIDVGMLAVRDLDVTTTLREAYSGMAVIVLAVRGDHALRQALRAGARGYLLKTRDRTEMAEAVRLVAAGYVVIDPDEAGVLLAGPLGVASGPPGLPRTNPDPNPGLPEGGR